MRPAALLRFVSRRALPLQLVALLPAFATLARAQWSEPGVSSLLTIQGARAGDLFGWRTSIVPDVDNDQVPEIAVSAPFHRAGFYGEGRVALFSGRTGQGIWSVNGSASGGIFGATMETIADFDGDGRRDFVVGQPYAPAGGLVALLSAATGQRLGTIVSPAPSASFGYAVATGGDVDGDGADDLVVAATNASSAGTNAGRLYVYTPGGTLLRTIDPPVATVVEFGCQVEFVPDLDQDGRDELVVGARQAGNLTVGFLYLLQPRASGVHVAWTATGFHHGTSIQGDRLVTGNDHDGDGVRDLVFGEPSASRARIVSPVTGAVLQTFSAPSSEWFGDVATVADLNHDGIDDVAIGGPGHAAGGQFSGRLYLWSGREGRLLQTMTSLAVQSSFGLSTSTFVDLDGDGTRDLVVSAPGGTQWGVGRVHVMRGEPCLAGWRVVAAGYPGATGVPTLAANGDPVLGTTTQLAVGSSATNPTTAVLVLGLAAASVPIPFGPTLWVRPDALSWLPVPAAGTLHPFVVPADAALCGFVVHAQSLLLDAGASGGVAASDAVAMTLGT